MGWSSAWVPGALWQQVLASRPLREDGLVWGPGCGGGTVQWKQLRCSWAYAPGISILAPFSRASFKFAVGSGTLSGDHGQTLVLAAASPGLQVSSLADR